MHSNKGHHSHVLFSRLLIQSEHVYMIQRSTVNNSKALNFGSEEGGVSTDALYATENKACFSNILALGAPPSTKLP